MSVSVPSLFEIFQTHLAWKFVILYRYAVHHQIDQNVKCIMIMKIEAISFQINLIYLGK
jgi:hypothetical protein